MARLTEKQRTALILQMHAHLDAAKEIATRLQTETPEMVPSLAARKGRDAKLVADVKAAFLERRKIRA